MSKIAGNYEDYTKEDLRSEIDTRGLEVPSSANKPDLVSALESDDKAKAKAENKAENKAESSGNTSGPSVATPPSAATAPKAVEPPKDKPFGKFKRKSDGLIFEIGTTTQPHFADRKYRGYSGKDFWEGNESDFTKHFTKETGEAIVVPKAT